MKTGRRRWLGGLLASFAALLGCQRKDADQLQRVARKAAEKVEAAAGVAQEPVASGWQMMRTGIDELSPEARVTARLRWDRELLGSSVRVKAVAGVIELRGGVTTADQKVRAIMIAETTAGVERVTDSLEVTGKP